MLYLFSELGKRIDEVCYPVEHVEVCFGAHIAYWFECGEGVLELYHLPWIHPSCGYL